MPHGNPEGLRLLDQLHARVGELLAETDKRLRQFDETVPAVDVAASGWNDRLEQLAARLQGLADAGERARRIVQDEEAGCEELQTTMQQLVQRSEGRGMSE